MADRTRLHAAPEPAERSEAPPHPTQPDALDLVLLRLRADAEALGLAMERSALELIRGGHDDAG